MKSAVAQLFSVVEVFLLDPKAVVDNLGPIPRRALFNHT